MKQSIRRANIGIATCALVAAIGLFAFRDQGEAALQLVGLVAFVSAFVVFFTLQGLAERREKERQ
jgi:lipopolysaccharide export LptBFGC system permease protein LptF